MDTKVTTVIVNDTKHGLTMKVGNRNCYARLTSVKEGGEYKMQIDVNWTYQEFLVQDKTDQANKVYINSDDCCDYERITIKEVDGKLDVQRQLREQFRTGSSVIEESGTKLSVIDESGTSTISSWKSWLNKCIHVRH
ncbi:hypothetical protein M758_7G143700 [Ceratodon purpureus]|uniref:DUF7748 domain-containing protein n=1 Tax=Ceratodon purpureus TaxID=3225 RepID=A0A8T0HEG9_CERPU|nr:hypothetical protein KC19_7G134400 [Ceratodon purpureus]KAG0611475.1 hypothetical protein M758_7G143700 [Ceratodon purpureus]